MNYIIIMYINNNNINKIIIDNYGMFQKLILFFKIPMDTQKNSFEIYRIFGYAPSKIFASRRLRYGLGDPVSKC